MKSFHTKESKYECEVCEKILTYRGNLLQHVKAVHDKVKSFVCTESNKTFTRNGKLTTHMRTHTKE